MVALGSSGGDHRVSLHDAAGVVLAEVACSNVLGLTWDRTLTEVSKASLSGSTAASFDVVSGVQPWVHWMSVWRGEDFVWQGPVQRLTVRPSGWVLTARDHATLHWRTRASITKTWTDTDPVLIAAEMWDAMTALHQVGAQTGAAATVASATSYTFSSVADERMSHQVLDDLVKMGIDWTVFAGRAVVMPSLRAAGLVFTTPELRDCDFAEEIEIGLDGTKFFNDVRVQGANHAETVIAPASGLRLQELVSIDSLVGVANIVRAAKQIASRSSTLRRTVAVPGGATLSPESDVQINGLMPGMVLPIYTDLAGGLRDLQRLEQVEVSVSGGSEKVAVTFGESPVQLADEDAT